MNHIFMTTVSVDGIKNPSANTHFNVFLSLSPFLSLCLFHHAYSSSDSERSVFATYIYTAKCNAIISVDSLDKIIIFGLTLMDFAWCQRMKSLWKRNDSTNTHTHIKKKHWISLSDWVVHFFVLMLMFPLYSGPDSNKFSRAVRRFSFHR